MHERQALALQFPGGVFPFTRVRVSGRLRRVMTVGLTAAALLFAGNTSGGGEPAQDAGVRQPPLTAEELQSVLPLLSKYFETRQLIADLESSIQQGDLTRAKQLVEQLREANTFEALTSKWLNGSGVRRDPPSPAETPEIRELRKALEDERERSRLLAREYSEQMDKLSTVQASQERDAAAEVELRQVLDRERERSQALEKEVASLTASAQEHQARGAAAGTEASELRKALEDERERSRMLAREYSEQMDKLSTVQASQERDAAAEVELRQVLDRERERSQALEKEVASLTASAQEHQARGAAAGTEASELRKALEDERERNQSLAREHGALTEKLASIQSTQSIPSPAQNGTTASRGAAQPDSSPRNLRVSPSNANPLVVRAEALLRSGDIVAARLLLERAADDASAVFLLAQTFDPRVLASLGVIGVRGDARKAEELYARARAMPGEQDSGTPPESAR